jgi:photosystem II stability/assembly factor-like uncharacterized protein
MFKSTDGGDSWQRLEFSPRGVTTVTIDPWTPSTLYAYGRGIFGNTCCLHKSTDAGVTWTHLPALTTTWTVRTIAIDPWRPSIVYAATPDSVHKTLDGGQSWFLVPDGLPAPSTGTGIGSGRSTQGRITASSRRPRAATPGSPSTPGCATPK